jgi:lambda repressor-like predicted transcriptional regulator
VWYDIAIFELITDGKKISQLSRETNISYKSLRNTYLKVKEFIKQEYEKYDWIRGHSGKDN